MDKKFYLKASEDNGFKNRSSQWFLIVGLKALKDKHIGKEYYELEVETNRGTQYLLVSDFNPETLNFKDESEKSVPFITVISYFKDRSIGLLIL